MLRVGLTGGIACGKSRVLRRLEASGCFTLDLDRVAHDVMAPGGPAHGDVVAVFGRSVLAPDGAIDRKALAAVVFHDAAARERLNAIVHPRVRAEEQRRTAALGSQPDAVVVVDAALLVEAGMHLRFDRLVVVHCTPEQQLQRLMARDALSSDQAAARIQAQMPIGQKRRFAHFEVDTSETLEATDTQADRLAAELLEMAKRPAVPSVLVRKRLIALLDGRSARFLSDVADAGGIEMFRVAALAGRARAGSWLAAAGEASPVAPELLMPAVAAWCRARRGRDDEWLGLAAASVARALTSEPSAVDRACVAAWRAARALGPSRHAIASGDARSFARRWSGPETDEAEWEPRESARLGEDESLASALDRFLAAANPPD